MPPKKPALPAATLPPTPVAAVPALLPSETAPVVSAEVKAGLLKTTEQTAVVGPLIEVLVRRGWKLSQMRYGKHEWRVPKNPSQATRREKGQSFDGWPCDIAVFDDDAHCGDPKHLLFIVECKRPDEDGGIAQLEDYLSRESRPVLGVWANSPEPSALAVYVYRTPDGSFMQQRRLIDDLPRPDDVIAPGYKSLRWNDLREPSHSVLRNVLSDLLDAVVARDRNVSDKVARAATNTPPAFRPFGTAAATATHLRDEFKRLVKLLPDVFSDAKDRELRLSDDTLAKCVDDLAPLKLLDIGAETVALGFQVLRAAALKQGEGQYFTPQPVIRAGIKLLQLQLDDLIIDPACGTGGFLVEAMLYMQRAHPGAAANMSQWAQTHLFGIEKDAVGVKLTKAIMQILGDGSAHVMRGDSVAWNAWDRDYKHLTGGNFANGRFSVVVTNPPFGQNLTVPSGDAQAAKLDIAQNDDGGWDESEIGLLFLNRAYQLLEPGGRLGIVLPETYFFSPSYAHVQTWIDGKFRPKVVVNIPMVAFQSFCRAKTNFYVFERMA
jgi:type I restriction enzyme M protein